MKLKVVQIGLSVAIGVSYLSAVADRFGFWGKAGEAGVAWGNYQNFLTYAKHLNGWAPEGLISTLGGVATGLEVLIAACLLIGYQRRYAAIGSGVLLGLFAVSMIFADGVKGPLDYGVFSAMMGSFLLAVTLDDCEGVKTG